MQKISEEFKKKILKKVLKKYFGGNIVLTGQEQSPIIMEAISLTKKEILKMIDEWIKEIENLNELNHCDGIKEIFEKSEVSKDKKMIKIAYESELFILRKLKKQIEEMK